MVSGAPEQHHRQGGVEVIFGLPGGGINGRMEALRIRQGKVRLVPVRHEETAAFIDLRPLPLANGDRAQR